MYACKVFDDSTEINVEVVQQTGRSIELSFVPPTRGLTMSRPLPADSTFVVVTHEGQNGATQYGGLGTSVTTTLAPTANGWRTVKQSD